MKETFERLFAAATGRIVVALFGSHLHRVKHTLDLAARLGRKVMRRGAQPAAQPGAGASRRSSSRCRRTWWCRWRPRRELLPHQVLVLCTGAQGEPRSALANFLSPEPGHFRVGPGDLVVLSSRTIPGNEMVVSDLMNRLLREGRAGGDGGERAGGARVGARREGGAAAHAPGGAAEDASCRSTASCGGTVLAGTVARFVRKFPLDGGSVCAKGVAWRRCMRST